MFICRMPMNCDRVQTLVAENRPCLLGIRVRQWPMTSSDDPYMGEESIMPPPSSKKAWTTSSRAARKSGSLPTFNVIQDPIPMIGIGSMLAGIARVARGAASAEIGSKLAAAPPAANAVRKARRSKFVALRLSIRSPKLPCARSRQMWRLVR